MNWKIRKLKRYNDIFGYLMAISFLFIFIGLILIVWYGWIGIKVLCTSLVSFLLFYLLVTACDKLEKQYHEELLKEEMDKIGAEGSD